MSAPDELRSLLRIRPIQLAALGLLLALVIWQALRLKFFVLDLDVWWHLKVGEWIVAHRAFPHTGILSRTAATRPWAAYSWGYELLLARFYHWLGLVGMGIYGTILTVGVAAAIFAMTRKLAGSFWAAYLITAAAATAFLFNLMPRPVFFSMMLYCAELTILFEAERRESFKALYWLPALFFLWGNFHIQFIYGLFVLTVFVASHAPLAWVRRQGWRPDWLAPSALPVRLLFLVLAACAVASCIGPNTYHVYEVVYGYVRSQFPYRFIREFQPLNFRAYSHFVQLLLTGAAFFALGRQSKLSLFKLLLLAAASAVAYRTMRDSWFICIAAAACLADSFWKGEPQDREFSWLELSGPAVALAVCMALFARNTDFNQAGLDTAISSQFPVKAVNFLRQNPRPGPLYNTFDWGGFLTWYMPDFPVAIDGRTDLYGDELDERFFKTANGDESYSEDPYLNEAGIILLQKEAPLVIVLGVDQRFQKIYEDKLAVVFVRRTDLGYPALPSPVVP
jgi:hypothetical protein